MMDKEASPSGAVPQGSDRPAEPLEVVRSALSFLDGSAVPWTEDAFRKDAELIVRDLHAAGFRFIRSAGIPAGIRDCCSECQSSAREDCFMRGQCRHYAALDELNAALAPSPTGTGTEGPPNPESKVAHRE